MGWDGDRRPAGDENWTARRRILDKTRAVSGFRIRDGGRVLMAWLGGGSGVGSPTLLGSRGGRSVGRVRAGS